MASYGEVAYGEVAYGGVAGGPLFGDLVEALTFSDAGTTAQSTYNTTHAEALAFADPLSALAVSILSETYVFGDSSAWNLVYRLIEALEFSELLTPSSRYGRLFSDSVKFDDTAHHALAELISEAMAFGDTPTYVRQWQGRLAEVFQLPDSAETTTTYNKLIVDALVLADLAEQYYRGTLSDSLALTDTVAGLRQFYAALVDSITASDSDSYLAVFAGGISDSVDLGDTVTSQLTLQALLADDLRFVVWDGTNRVSYAGYVMNTKVGGLTEYQNYNFNSIAKIGASYYGASSTGLYLLEGADDAGTDIEARIKFGAFNPGSGKKSRVEQAYIGVRSDGKVIFKTFADDGKERWYETQALHGDLQTQRAKLGRGVKSRYWQFELMNRDGEALDLEQFEFLPITMTRRV